MPQVRLIDENEEQLGIMPTDQAMTLAHERELDLVEVSPRDNPPVCKLMDYGKYLYHQKKVEQKHRKMQKKTEVKGIRLGFRTDKHDIETKIKQAKRFLEDRDVVKVSLVFKGREASHAHLAVEKLRYIADQLKEIAHLEQPPKRQGNILMMILSPLK